MRYFSSSLCAALCLSQIPCLYAQEDASLLQCYQTLERCLKAQYEILMQVQDRASAQAALAPYQSLQKELAQLFQDIENEHQFSTYLDRNLDKKETLLQLIKKMTIEMTRLLKNEGYGVDAWVKLLHNPS